jgi:hypothetical protein
MVQTHPKNGREQMAKMSAVVDVTSEKEEREKD